MTELPEKNVIGFDLGGTTMAAALIDRQLKVMESLEQETPLSSQEALLEGILAMVRRLIDSSAAAVGAVGFGIPSMIDQTAGKAVMSVNIPLADFAFVDYMASELDLPVFIDNDANVAALAETRAGAARGATEVIMITLGTGIGGGIVIGGEVYRGHTGSAAELGHMTIDVNGPRCQGNCEGYGCFETMASATALNRYAIEIAGQQRDSALGRAHSEGRLLDGALLFELAGQGDEASRKVWDIVGFYLGIGIVNLVNIFNPEVLVVGGGLAKAGDLLMGPANKVLAQRGLRPNRDVVRIETASFGPDAGMIGAACMAFSELDRK